MSTEPSGLSLGTSGPASPWGRAATVVLVALAATSTASQISAQPPLTTVGPRFHDFNSDWHMGRSLAARGERMLFSGDVTSATWFFPTPPPDGISLISFSEAVAAGPEQVALYNGASVKIYTWIDGSQLVDGPTSVNDCGEALALDADTLVLGCASHNGDRGQAKILTGGVVETVDGTVVGARLGAAVAYDGNTVAIGEPHDLSGQTGKVHIFRNVGGTWTDFGDLEAPDGEAGNAFGAALALSGSWLAVGAPLDDVFFFPDPTPESDVGTVHLYRKTGLLGAFDHRLTLYGGAAGDNFGAALAMSPTTLVVGAPKVNGPNPFVDIGRAYVYWRAGDDWTYAARLGASGVSIGDFFATTVALFDDGVVAGAPGHDDTDANGGAIYLFPGLVPLFLDGFEGGDTTLWSSTTP